MSTPLSYSMAGAVAATGLSKSTLERAIKAGRLRAKKSDQDEDGNPTGVWVITHEALMAFVDGLVDA
ncbi:hypothetical protein [Nocardioides sp. BYT-33-1]|uniref:hypothetical protein n=1 Tax=Nocardioides sp. BYT-33-1 TaxID=3416952 RepID=UPI003F52BAD9